MACCLICFSDKPVEGSKLDNYYANPNQFQIGMMEAPCKNFCGCCFGFACPCCSQMVVRNRALEGNMQNYLCCQGYFPGCGPCCKPGQCGERSCPWLCLCIEASMFTSCAVSANRMYLMDKYSLVPDPWDNRIIRFNNCIQLLSCICNLLSICIGDLRPLAQLLDCFAEVVYLTTVGCMTGQMLHELDYQSHSAPKAEAIMR